MDFIKYHFRYYTRLNQVKEYLRRIIELQDAGLSMVLCHKCNKGAITLTQRYSCSQPSHLFLATQGNNLRDVGVTALLAAARNQFDIETIQQLHGSTGGAVDAGIPLTGLDTVQRALHGANENIFETDIEFDERVQLLRC